MKCIKELSSGKIIRVNDSAARELVSSGKYRYVSKQEWKSSGRAYEKRIEHELAGIEWISSGFSLVNVSGFSSIHCAIYQQEQRSMKRSMKMYTHRNFKTKKALKEAVANGEKITVFQPGPFASSAETQNGTVYLEGPHYPAAHSWYASATLKDGIIVKVK